MGKPVRLNGAIDALDTEAELREVVRARRIMSSLGERISAFAKSAVDGRTAEVRKLLANSDVEIEPSALANSADDGTTEAARKLLANSAEEVVPNALDKSAGVGAARLFFSSSSFICSL